MIDFFHSVFLLHMEWTAGLTMSASNTGVSMDGEFSVVTFCHFIPNNGKVVVFIDKSYIYPHRTGLTVIAIDARTRRALRRKLAYKLIVLFLRRRGQIFQNDF